MKATLIYNVTFKELSLFFKKQQHLHKGTVLPFWRDSGGPYNVKPLFLALQQQQQSI